MSQHTLGVLLFPGFELLDVFGPLEAWGHLTDHVRIVMAAEQAGPVPSAQGPAAHADASLRDCPRLDLLLVPGGIGTRAVAESPPVLEWIARRAAEAEVVMSVCTGSAILARAGVLDGKRATSNKAVFQWVTEQGPRVTWVPRARWVEDGKFVTSSGVSAGIDMTLAVIARRIGQETAEILARGMEYDWHRDAGWDPFAEVYGL